MRNRKISLLKLSFVIAIVGILLLLVLANILPSQQIKIEKINNKLLNKKITTSGEILNLINYDNFQIISIQDETGKIDITFNKILNLKKAQKITVIGKITEYKGNLQIQADKIIVN